MKGNYKALLLSVLLAEAIGFISGFLGMAGNGAALIELLILLAFIILTTVEFYRLDRTAGRLMIPYILWVAFAAFLNYGIWMLNRI